MMPTDTAPASGAEHEDSEVYSNMRFTQRNRSYFLVAAMLFLATALILYVLTGYMLYKLSLHSADIFSSQETPPTAPGNTATPATPEISGNVTQRDVFTFFQKVVSYSISPLICLAAAAICTVVGIRLLRSSGVVVNHVIAPDDYPILGPAIARGDEQAVSQYIRLSSLSGMTGTFTKIGLTGLPLATIFLTVFLGLLGIANSAFFDLAKLTLGAFLGSFVQRQSSEITRRSSQ
jgi:hypothetical protein